MEFMFSLTTRAGSVPSSVASHKSVSLKTQAKQTRMELPSRVYHMDGAMLQFPRLTRSSYRAFSGLIMALEDPKVLLFSVMNFSQILGFSYANFFPT